jgi:type IV secretory pathway VirB9-like protein
MKRIVTSIGITCAMAAGVLAHAASTDPFDFDYEIDGGLTERPALIFNDGSKTYIQPRAGQVITADGGHAEDSRGTLDQSQLVYWWHRRDSDRPEG